MGRKKRKVEETEPVGSAENESEAPPAKKQATGGEPEKLQSSGYAMTSHAGVIVEADIYVSDGSEDEEDDVDVLLSNSRTGLMRRGLLPSAAATQMHHKQWVREDAEAEKEEEDWSQLDPVERAARLQAEKLRQEQQEKQAALLRESQQNAGRDPTLFSKRTAFDIRFDQMEEKPWIRLAGTSGNQDFSDFFNYGLTEETWLEYAQQQMTIRQELIDAARNKRPPDPNIVPVTPLVPQTQQPKVAVTGNANDKEGEGDKEGTANEPVEVAPEPMAPLGPSLPSKLPSATTDVEPPTPTAEVPAGVGGAWGAGAAPGSHLAKLIAEQEQRQQQQSYGDPSQSYHQNNSTGYDQDEASQTGSYYSGTSDSYRGGPPRRGGRGGRGRGGRGRGGYNNGGGDDYYGRKRPRDDWRR